MTLNQLFLKDLTLHARDVTTLLPLAPTNLVFVHRENRGRGQKKQEYEIAAYFEGNVVQFLNLRDLSDRTKFYELMDKLGVNWDDCYDQLRERYKKTNDGEDLNTFDVIVGPELFVDIDLNSLSILKMHMRPCSTNMKRFYGASTNTISHSRLTS